MPQFRTVARNDLVGPMCICGACLIAFATLLNHANSLSSAEQPKTTIPRPAASFSIEKTEGHTSHDVYVTYLKKDWHLTDVNAFVTIQYLPGARPRVTRYWANWASGEKKTFSNTDSRFGRINKVEFRAIAREHSFKDGKETVTWVRFAESRSFEPGETTPQTINAD